MEAIPEGYLKTVVFLCVDETTPEGTRRLPKATGFFVRVPLEGSKDSAIDYVVTARHCIDEAQQYGQLYIRFNRLTGEFIEHPTNVNDWYLDEQADVAVIPMLPAILPHDIKPTDLDTKSLSLDSFVGGAPDYKRHINTQFGEKEIQPRVGHQVFFLGLFTQHYGVERNSPIARFGHISKMPDWVNIELNGIDTRVIAYLVEFHSWGGHSGSPVFFLYPAMALGMRSFRLTNGEQLDIPVDVDLLWTTGLMGLVSGHYDIEKQARKTGDILGDIQVQLNTGVAIVTPADSIRQLLMREDLVKQRNELKRKAESRIPRPTLDIAGANDDFPQDSKKVSRRKSDSKQS